MFCQYTGNAELPKQVARLPEQSAGQSDGVVSISAIAAEELVGVEAISVVAANEWVVAETISVVAAGG